MKAKTIVGPMFAAYALICGGVFVVGCGGRVQTSQGPDSSTHWLSACDEDDDCGGLSCLCGVCTRECDEVAMCSGLGATAVCAEVAGCGVAQVCARECDGGGCLESPTTSPPEPAPNPAPAVSSPDSGSEPIETTSSPAPTMQGTGDQDACADVLSALGDGECVSEVAKCEQVKTDGSVRVFTLSLTEEAPGGQPYTSNELDFNADCLLSAVAGQASRVDNRLEITGTWSDVEAVMGLRAITRYRVDCVGGLCEYCTEFDKAECEADAFCGTYDGWRYDPQTECFGEPEFFGCMDVDEACGTLFSAGVSEGSCWVFSDLCDVNKVIDINDADCNLLYETHDDGGSPGCLDPDICYSPEDPTFVSQEGISGCACDVPNGASVCTGGWSFSCVGGYWLAEVDGICTNGAARCDRTVPTLEECLASYSGCVAAESLGGYCAIDKRGGGERPTFTQQDCTDLGGLLSDDWDPANLWVVMTTAEPYCLGPEDGIAAETCEAIGGRADCLGPTEAWRPSCEGDETPIVEISECSHGHCCLPDESAP